MSRARSRATWIGGAAIAALAASLVSSPSQALQGVDSDAAAHPYSAHILVGASDRACSGALVAPQWVLTSKSCFADATGTVPSKPGATTRVTVGRPDLTQTTAGASRTATALVAHPDRDLVMVRLSARVNNVQPVALATTPAAAGQELRAAGYGRTKTSWVPDRLHTAAFTAATVGTTSVDLTASADAGLCKGDAGGPVVRVNGTTRELVAVAGRSWQGGCLGTDPFETRTDAVATRTDDVRSWVTATAFRAQGDMTGDKIGDLTAVWDDSTLHSYPGLGNGQLGSQIPLIGGTTWSTIKHLTKGDFTGDGIADLMSIWGDGTLHYYRGKGDGTIDTQRVVALGGDTWLPIKNIAAGDFNKDGVDDLITIWGDGTLHLYTGKGDGQLNNGITVTQGAATWSTVKHIAAGDFNKDGVADLMAIWGDGSLHLYTGKGDGQLNAGTTMIGGTTWSTIKHLTAGDFNKDGAADLKAVWNDGTLRYYSGKGDGTINTQIQVTVGGTTWGSVRQLA
ncbi:FG-GAP-like repeat-containing protein [Streptomyces sp. NPDC088090]|uniref:FG-GAP-like repeat-containing protein n=1 Tax=Streptomyces sp. NPDC088090 TaxID=3365822 RepID=UPI00384D1F04